MDDTGTAPTGEPTTLLLTPAAEIRTLRVGPMDNNAYLLTCRSTGAQMLIDAAAEHERLLALVGQGSPTGRLDLLVTTHCHIDHIGALWEMADATGATVAVGAEDADAVERVTTVRVERRLRDGDVLRVGELEVSVIGLRGHTPGSIALALDAGDHPYLFTGDSLFPGGLGKTDHDRERFDRLYDDVTARLFDRFDDDARVRPGHGAGTTLGAERPHLDEWWDRGW